MFVAPIVLAGGKSTRFGRDKTTQLVGGQTLIERVIHRLAAFGDEIIVVLAPGGTLPPFPSPVKLRKVFDIYPERGSLGGVYTGLVLSPHQYNLVVASDMPFLNEKLLRHMIDQSPGYDVVIPRVGKNVEPLHAVYSRSCIPIIEKVWQRGQSKVLDILQYARTYYLDEKEIEQFDHRHLSFFNVNTPGELKRAIDLAREIES
ncbi:MAG: molybdenum cofactor guanylyltransferase [Chloroflexi bacterium]|nr:molybdenum cofactor guanylyltransferase [Chloroflexota bacterium]